MTRPRRTTGFTLIELLVSISIIALLIGLLFPAISRVRTAGRKVECLNNLRQMGVAVTGYMDAESGGLLPVVAPVINPTPLGNTNDPSLLNVLEDYIDAQVPRREDPNDETSPYIVEPPFRCPEDRSSDDPDAQFRAIHEEWGTSYAYLPGFVPFVLENLQGIPGPYGRAITSVWRSRADRNQEPALLYDFDDWHGGSGGSGGKLAVFLTDGHADVLKENEGEDVIDELIAETLESMNLGAGGLLP